MVSNAETGHVAVVRAYVARDFGSELAGHDLDHLDRVAKLGMRIAAQLPADPEIVGIAAYVHDLHRVVEFESRAGTAISADAVESRTRAALADCGVAAEVAEAVVDAVAFNERYLIKGDTRGISRTRRAEVTC